MSDVQKASEHGVTRWDPFPDFDRFRRQLDELSTRWPSSWFETLDVRFVPPADIEETDEAWIVDVELPGVDKKDVEVEVHGHTVVISGERKEKERTGVVRQKKRVTGSFRYEVSLPGDFDETEVHASMKDGELTVRLPKTEADQPHKIKVI